MEHNKSLSARIKRRNNKRFLGFGNHALFRPCEGDYKDEKQNHKERPLYQSAINVLRKRGHKRSGTKSFKVLKQYM